MPKGARRLLVGLGCLLALGWSTLQAREQVELVGLNVAGAEFTGKHGTHYFFPPKGYFAAWREKGVRMVRFPLKWERLQASLNAELDPVYSDLVDKMLDQAAENDIKIIIDVHNYARYRGNVIGTEDTGV